MIVDSIQTMYRPDMASAPGSVSQVRECASLLMRMAKTTGCAVFLVGHVTKEGAIAGPRVLEHMVDVVLYFEGDRQHEYRILRAVKKMCIRDRDMGGYSANPICMQDHSKDGYVDGVNTFDAKNDRGYEWWTSADGGRLVVEDPEYCAQVSFDLGDWIDMIVGSK